MTCSSPLIVLPWLFFNASAAAADPPGEEQAIQGIEEHGYSSMLVNSLNTNVDVAEVSSTRSGWNVTIELGETMERVVADASTFQVEVYANERMRDAGRLRGSFQTISIDSDELSDGDHLMFAVTLVAPTEVGVGYRYLRRVGTELKEESLEEYLRGRSLHFPSGSVFIGAPSEVVPNPQSLHLPPWENPLVLPDDQARSYAHATETDPLATTSGALQADQSGSDENPGCSTATSSYALILFLLLWTICARRRTLSLAALILSLGALGADRANATVVYGYVGFWDSRSGSDYPGSRLGTCTTSNTTCGVGAANCCTRGIPYVEVTMRKKDGVVVAATSSSLSGYFEFPNTTYTNSTYDLVVTYTRSSAPTSQVITENATGAVPFSSFASISVPQPTGAYTDLGTRRVNLASDTSSKEGNIATAWHALTFSFYYLEGENEYRQRKILGSANSFDQIVFRYRSTGVVNECQSSNWFPPSESRLVSMHEHAGTIALGRALGCVGGNVVPGQVPAWPDTIINFRNPSIEPTAESGALAYGLHRLVSLISRFAPAVATVGNVKGGTGINCFNEFSGGTDLYPKSNSSAWSNNNALALWELIDFDTSGADDSVNDDVNTDMHTILDAVAANYAATGAPGTNRTVNEYRAVVTSTTCTNNESCPATNVCGPWPLSASVFCYEPDTSTGQDPNAGNVGDMAYYLPSGIGNVGNTIKSSACMRGGPDDGYPFNGSHQDL